MQPDGFDLTDRVALLTGTGSGIGRATARTLAAAGAVVVGADLDPDAAEATVAEIRAAGGRAEAHRLDVTDREAFDALVEGTVERHGRLDILGNIAGIPHNRLVAEVTDDELDRVLAVNAKSVFYGCRAAARVMVPQGRGVIVNVSSGAIDTPAPTLACYAMAKAAVAMLTRTLATEVGPAGVRVNALAPGVIETNFSRQHFVDETGAVVPERLEAYRKRFGQMAPLRRVGTPQDVADAFWYLVSDRAAFVTGQVLRPNGGVAMPW